MLLNRRRHLMGRVDSEANLPRRVCSWIGMSYIRWLSLDDMAQLYRGASKLHQDEVNGIR